MHRVVFCENFYLRDQSECQSYQVMFVSDADKRSGFRAEKAFSSRSSPTLSGSLSIESALPYTIDAYANDFLLACERPQWTDTRFLGKRLRYRVDQLQQCFVLVLHNAVLHHPP